MDRCRDQLCHPTPAMPPAWYARGAFQGSKPAGQAAVTAVEIHWSLTFADRVRRAPWRCWPIRDDAGQFATFDRGATGPATIRNLRFLAVPAPEPCSKCCVLLVPHLRRMLLPPPPPPLSKHT